MWFKNLTKEKYEEVIKLIELEDTEKLILKIVWLDYLFLLERKAFRNHWMNNFIQITVIFLSLVIPVLEGMDSKYFKIAIGFSYISIISLFIAIITSFSNQLRFEAKWSHSRKNAEIVRNEGEDFFALAGNYSSCSNHKEAFRSFITKITLFKRQEVTTYLEGSNNKNGKQQPPKPPKSS